MGDLRPVAARVGDGRRHAVRARVLPGRGAHALDRYVVNWSLQDQRLFAATVQRQAKDVSLALKWPSEWRSKLWVLVPAGIVVVAMLAWVAWRFGQVGQIRQADCAAALLRAACGPSRTRALPGAGGDGSAVLGARQARDAGLEPLGHITTTYERMRFGSVAPTEDDAGSRALPLGARTSLTRPLQGVVAFDRQLFWCGAGRINEARASAMSARSGDGCMRRGRGVVGSGAGVSRAAGAPPGDSGPGRPQCRRATGPRPPHHSRFPAGTTRRPGRGLQDVGQMRGNVARPAEHVHHVDAARGGGRG